MLDLSAMKTQATWEVGMPTFMHWAGDEQYFKSHIYFLTPNSNKLITDDIRVQEDMDIIDADRKELSTMLYDFFYFYTMM